MTSPQRARLYHRPVLWFGLLLAVLLFQPIGRQPALAQDSEPIRVISSDAENNYPDSLTFRIRAEADQPIVKIHLYYRTQGSGSTTRQPVDFETGTRVSAAYTWDTSRITVAPSTPVVYYWKLEDQAGNQLTTPEQVVYYDDLRFPWREISDPKLIVRWYEGDDALGQAVYDTAQKALAQMVEQSGQELDYPVYVLLYADDEDFGSWHSYVDKWVGGQAFPPLGVTAQIVPPSTSRAWIEDVIPHEIAHLFFYQVMQGGMSSWPAWLDEGLAQYYEFGSPEASLARVERAARQGGLLPLVSLSGGFGRDPEQVRLSYDQSLSAVTYLLETWGDKGLQDLIAALKGGQSIRAAVESALGVTWEEFEAGWISWLGVPTTPSAPPTPTPTLVRPTAPSGWPTPTRRPTVTATQDASAQAPPDQVSPTPAQPSPTVTATPGPQASPTPTERPGRGPSRLPCGGAALGPLLIAGTALLARRRDKTA